MENILNKGELFTIESKYVVIGTSDISLWTDGKPFIVALDTKDDFAKNGLYYDEYKDMKIGDVKDSCSMEEGIMVIRIK